MQKGLTQSQGSLGLNNLRSSGKHVVQLLENNIKKTIFFEPLKEEAGNEINSVLRKLGHRAPSMKKHFTADLSPELRKGLMIKKTETSPLMLPNTQNPRAEFDIPVSKIHDNQGVASPNIFI